MTQKNSFRKISIAPMMDYTDRHYRYFMRLITKKTLLYTEMITSSAIVHGNAEKLLQFNHEEHPIALQLGGSEPKALAEAAKIGETFGYDEINLNVGCPSDRVQSGKFGACLLYEPERVAECVAAMRSVASIPVTIKTRLGVDDHDSYEALHYFVNLSLQAGCNIFIFHARKAWLKGLSPKENRTVPPLQYDVVYRLKKDFPNLQVGINGGIQTLEEIKNHLQFVDEVMLGRIAVAQPMLFYSVDSEFYQASDLHFSFEEIVERYLSYVLDEQKKGERLSILLRPLFGLKQGQSGARAWRKSVTDAIQAGRCPIA